MKAAVCREFNTPLRIEDVTLDSPKVGEIKVTVAASAICHSDIHIMDGDFDDGVVPLVAGHEAAGIVSEVGEGVTTFNVGDRIMTSLLRSCSDCSYCRAGLRHLCEGVFPTDGQDRLWTSDRRVIQRGANMAAFAEEIVVHHSQAIVIPDSVPLDSASLLGCGVITGTGSVFNTTEVRPGQSVAVIGCGGVGLNAIQAASIAGASPIFALDLVESKLDISRAFGAHHTINTASDSIEAVKDLTGGRGVDYAFVTVGSVKAGELALQLLNKRGTAVFIGLPGMAKISVSIYQLVLGEQRIIGSAMGSTQLQRDVPRLLDYYQQKQLKLDELITQRYPLDAINEAIESVKQGNALRNVITF